MVFADKYGLRSTLLRGVINFAAANKSAMEALINSKEYATFSAELVRLIHAHPSRERVDRNASLSSGVRSQGGMSLYCR